MHDLVSEKRRVHEQFDRVARSYDRFATMNPGYSRHLRMSAARLRLGPKASILDLCCGTGLSTEALVSVYPEAAITGLDASEGMLEGARKKSWPEHVRFVHGDAMDPAASAGVEPPFDGILMAYGIRNVPDADACLVRLRELLVPGGVICFHEFSVADSRLRTAVWNAVSYGVIIPGGLVMGGSSKIYRYLRKSVVDFDGVTGFESRLRHAGFVDVMTEPTDGWQRGIVHSFIARRPR